jgi:exodeoxyribonuclease VII large subunit
MAQGDDRIPTLAELRKARGSRRQLRVAEPPAPALFDLFSNESVISLAGEMEERERLPASPPILIREEAQTPKVYTVGELVGRARGLVENAFRTVSVEGEISNWRPAGSGHCYFTLKDGAAQLAIVMFRAQALRLNFRPKDGDAVRITGSLTIYENRGQMQMVAEAMTQVGLGALLAATRELKERLRCEGLFDRKRPLPAFPKCIGVVTSLQGAALRDIVKVCRRRHAGVNLLVYPAAVQGPRCPAEIARGIRWFSAHPERADVVLVARGGGSWEDLHGFDDERVVRAIAACSVPVISGIGHAMDSTLTDAAADVCAPTPSAAAELVTAAHFQIEGRVERLAARVQRAGRYEMLRARQRFSRLSTEQVLRRVQEAFGRRAQRLDELDFRADGAAQRRLRSARERLARLEARTRRREPAALLRKDHRLVEAIESRLARVANSLVRSCTARLEQARVRLDSMSPQRVLDRGYSLIYTADGGATEGRLVREAADVYSGQTIVARTARGRIRARVEYTE